MLQSALFLNMYSDWSTNFMHEVDNSCWWATFHALGRLSCFYTLVWIKDQYVFFRRSDMRIPRNQFIKAKDSQYTGLCILLTKRSAWQNARRLSGIIQLTERGKAHAGVYHKGLALNNFRSESRKYKNAIYWKGPLQYICHTPAIDDAVVNWWTSFLMQSLIIKVSIWLLHGILSCSMMMWICKSSLNNL